MRLPRLRLPSPSATAAQVPRRALPNWALALLAFFVAGFIALLFSWAAVLLIERRTERAVRAELTAAAIDWVKVDADGLHLELAGTAPTEAARFRAVNIAGKVIDAERIRDMMEVTPASAIEAPRFSVEMLRNDDGIQLIGLLPDEETSNALTAAAAGLTPSVPVSAMLETAAYPPPSGWQAAYEYGLTALKLLPRSKISVDAAKVEITAIAASETEKRRLELELGRSLPEGIEAVIDISAPRPVLTPFPLRFVVDAEGARFDACAADTDAARNRILAAAAAAGLEGAATCTVGLGVPTPRWAEGAEAGIRAVAALGAGTITFADADVTLLAADTVPQETFDRVVGELQAALPPVFSLDAQLPKKQDAAPSGPAEFTAELASTGRVELRGRLTDEMQRDAVDNFAKARFGAEMVYTATRLDPELPDGWPVRVLAGLSALAELESGKLLVRPDTVEIAGVTGSQQARGKISQILSGKLGQGQTFKVAVRYDESLDPLAALPTPEECVAKVQGLLSKQKITFTPGSAEIDASARGLMNAIAEALVDCPDLPLEIAGHTDAQGSEEGNRALSQARAEAVLVALQGRRVDINRMKAVGYGESRPIADNESEEGREANRRIEITLIGAKPATASIAAPQTDPNGKTGPNIQGTTVSARPVPANAQACVADVQTLLKKQKITFKPGSAEITDQAAGLMTALATLLKQCPGVAVEIGGHTDAQGTERNNRTLSKDRAEAVLAALKDKGVDTSAMTAVGYGEDKPIAENDTEEGRETNRRIEFVLSGAAPAEGQAAAPDAAGGPSLAPTEKTLRPKARPANND